MLHECLEVLKLILSYDSDIAVNSTLNVRSGPEDIARRVNPNDFGLFLTIVSKSLVDGLTKIGGVVA